MTVKFCTVGAACAATITTPGGGSAGESAQLHSVANTPRAYAGSAMCSTHIALCTGHDAILNAVSSTIITGRAPSSCSAARYTL